MFDRELQLIEGPAVPEHVELDAAGVAYLTRADWASQPLPEKFKAPLRASNLDEAWATVVFGLETGRDGVRERFVAGLNADAAAGLPLSRAGDALEAAFADTFGGRGKTSQTPGFLEFVQRTLDATTHPAVRAQLQRCPRDFSERPVDARIAAAGARAVAFGVETGHVPADHPRVLYWLADFFRPLHDAHFSQVAAADDEPIVLEAWWQGQVVRGQASSRDDFIDVWSCAGLINVLLRDGVHSEARVVVIEEDGAALVIGGTPAALDALRADGVLGARDDDSPGDE